MVGANTVIADNPRLSARGCINRGGLSKNQPLRVIVDGRGRTPLDSQVFKEPGKTLMVVSNKLGTEKKDKFIQAGAEIEAFATKKNIIDLSQLLGLLGKRGITTILVEGGGMLLGDLFDHNLVDKVMVCIAPIVIGGEGAISPVSGKGISSISEALRLHHVKITPRGDDIFVDGYLKDN
jgi:diaminohydroxyphosphoribosylaminopyrimidine deaminase/5-amino-6-(5-phosphoribosylamino)uracil reductase